VPPSGSRSFQPAVIQYVAKAEKVRGRLSTDAQAGIKNVTQCIPREVEAEYGQRDRAGISNHRPRMCVHALPLGAPEIESPGGALLWNKLRDDESESGFSKDDYAEAGREHDDDGGHNVRENVERHRPGVGSPNHPCRLDVLLLSRRQHDSPHHSLALRYADKPQSESHYQPA